MLAMVDADIDIKAAEKAICDTLTSFRSSGFTDRKIAKELALIAFSDIQDYVTVDEGGSLQVLPLSDLKKHKSRAIKKIKEKATIKESNDGKSTVKYSSLEFELHDKLEAIKTAIDCMGIKKPSKLDVNMGGNIMATVAKVLTEGK
ncbi:MAG TPA: hypothetical protein PLC99_24520 [Verrucomicrobiota bacterium]|nr:hypothetical protein [Verrucomicrobiota bacterium]